MSSIVGPIEYQNLKGKIESPMPSYILEGRPQRVSSELAEVIGLERATPHECIRRLWAYIKEKNLQDPENKQFFIPDSKMAKVFGVNKFKGFSMGQHLIHHLSHISDFELL